MAKAEERVVQKMAKAEERDRAVQKMAKAEERAVQKLTGHHAGVYIYMRERERETHDEGWSRLKI
jgi:hypothetical protein